MKTIGVFLAALGIAGYILTIGYFAWKTEKVVELLDSVVTEQKNFSREFDTTLVKLKSELQKNSTFPKTNQWIRSIEKPLAARIKNMVHGINKNSVRDELKKWSGTLQKKEEKRLQKLLESFRNNRELLINRIRQQKNQWQILLRTLQEDRKFAMDKYKEEVGRWDDLLITMGKDREAAKNQYIETVNLLNKERSMAIEAVRHLEEERKREVVKLLNKAKLIEEERKKKLSQFCNKRPESVICRDL